MLYAQIYLTQHASRLSAYNNLQRRLMRRFLGRGGSLEDWCTRIAPAFRARYGWMLAEQDARRDLAA